MSYNFVDIKLHYHLVVYLQHTGMLSTVVESYQSRFYIFTEENISVIVEIIIPLLSQ